MGEDQIWAALAEPNRRAILDALVPGELTVTGIAEKVGLSQPLASKHLRVLREAHLVTARVSGQQRLHALDPDALIEVDRWLAPHRRRWTSALDRLDEHLATSPSEAPDHVRPDPSPTEGDRP